MSFKTSIFSILLCLLFALFFSFASSRGNAVTLNSYPLFAICGFISFMLHWTVFVPSYLLKTELFFDITGSICYLAILSFAIYNKPNIDFRALIIFCLISIWAIRLGSFLFLRVKRKGLDSRFTIMKTKFWWFLFTWTMSGLWVLITSGPAVAVLTTDVTKAISWMGYLGIILWVIGFTIEVTADNQKSAFLAKEKNKDNFINSGLWAWSRHPNYFGEILLWFGVSLLALPVLSGLQLVTLVSPVFVYFLLTKISGIPMLEARADKKWGGSPNYIVYKKNTPSLFPSKP
mgnify:CR=1 FL=1